MRPYCLSLEKEWLKLTGDIAELGVFANLVGRPGTNRVAIDVNNGLLPHVQPDDGPILGPFVATGLLDGLDKALLGGLAATKDLVTRNSPEVWHAINLVWQLLDLFKVIQHGRSLGYVAYAGQLGHLELCLTKFEQ